MFCRIYSILVMFLLLTGLFSSSSCSSSEATLETEQQEPTTETNTTANTSLMPIVPNPITGEQAQEIVLQYVSEKTGVPIEFILVGDEKSLIRDENKPPPLYNVDVISGEQVYYFHISNKRNLLQENTEEFVFLKLIVDSHGNVMDYWDYQRIVRERNKAITGNMNPGFYKQLIDSPADKIIKIKLFTKQEDSKNVANYIESQGYSVSDIGDLLNGGSLFYADLPVSFILSLRHRDDISSMERYLPTVLP